MAHVGWGRGHVLHKVLRPRERKTMSICSFRTAQKRLLSISHVGMMVTRYGMWPKICGSSSPEGSWGRN